MTTYLISHMPKQPEAGRLAQHGTGMIAQAIISARTDTEALDKFYEKYPEREHTGMVAVQSSE